MVNPQLRSGADGAIVDDEGKPAVGLVLAVIEEEGSLTEDDDLVRNFLANTPADARHLRGYLVLRRVHADKVP